MSAAAVGLGVVTAEGVTRSCGHGDGGHRSVIGGGDRRCSSGGGILVVERHGVLIGRPLGIEVHRTTIGSGKVLDALLVIVNHVAILRRCPASEGVARAGEGVGSEVLRCAVGEDRVAHGAATAVGIELHGISVGHLLGSEGHVATAHGVGTSDVIAVGLINDVIACGDIEAGGKRQLEALAVVEVVFIDEAVIQTGGGGVDGRADTGDATAEDHLTDAAYIGAGIALADTAIGATVVVEVFEGTAAIAANDGAFVVYVSPNSGAKDHTVLNSGIVGFANKCTKTCTFTVDCRADQADVLYSAILDIAEEPIIKMIV